MSIRYQPALALARARLRQARTEPNGAAWNAALAAAHLGVAYQEPARHARRIRRIVSLCGPGMVGLYATETRFRPDFRPYRAA